jgi:uncharacterized integral membrane protein
MKRPGRHRTGDGASDVRADPVGDDGPVAARSGEVDPTSTGTTWSSRTDPETESTMTGSTGTASTGTAPADPALAEPPMADPATGTATDPAAGPLSGPMTAGPVRPSSSKIVKRTRISGTWVAVVVAAIVLIFLLIFILQNQATATVRFLGFSGSLPLGVAMLFATIAGALLVALIGTARILQLRRRVRRIDH